MQLNVIQKKPTMLLCLKNQVNAHIQKKKIQTIKISSSVSFIFWCFSRFTISHFTTVGGPLGAKATGTHNGLRVGFQDGTTGNTTV